MEYKNIILEKDNGISVITLNRPEKLNALTPSMRVEMRAALEDVAADNNVRVMILTGAGRGFCAGADIDTVAANAEWADDEPARALRLQPVSTYRLVDLIKKLEKPSICALNGVVAGGPIGLPLACDIILASDQARFRIALTRVGLTLENELSYHLSRRIGTHMTLELAYTNDLIDAKEMERIGLVNHVYPHDELMPKAKEMARRMFLIPPIGLALTKQIAYRGLSAPNAESQMYFEKLAGSILHNTEDQKEAVKSFMEKRDPQYKGK